jgi:hypothetical protein
VRILRFLRLRKKELMTTSEVKALESLGKAGQDARTAAEYLHDLEREAKASLRRDPGRRPWRRTDETPDTRRQRGSP